MKETRRETAFTNTPTTRVVVGGRESGGASGSRGTAVYLGGTDGRRQRYRGVPGRNRRAPSEVPWCTYRRALSEVQSGTSMTRCTCTVQKSTVRGGTEVLSYIDGYRQKCSGKMGLDSLEKSND